MYKEREEGLRVLAKVALGLPLFLLYQIIFNS
jgi:hypothetical protein